MESGSVLSEPVNTSVHRGFPNERSSSMTIISSKSANGTPRMSTLENLEAKMANIEVSLSSSNGRRRKAASLNGTISARSSPRPETKELRTAAQDREAVIQNLRIQLGLGKLPRPSGPPLDESDRPAAEQKLARLKIDAENKRIAIRNLKSALDKLDITDNIDVRIRQAELEYALGREELQLLSLVEEARALQLRLDKSKPESNCLFSTIQSGTSLSLHAVQATVGRWAANIKSDSPGLYVEWALEGEGLFRGDRIIEVNGKIVAHRTREELQSQIGTTGKCQLVVIRRKTTAIPQQQLIQQQEDNQRLQHRISYLEEQVRELQTAKESPPASVINGINGTTSGHVTSISISSPPSTPPEYKPQVFQRGNYVTTLIGGKPIELTAQNVKAHITKTLIKENGCHTDTESGYTTNGKSLSASKISINSDIPITHHHKNRRAHSGSERERNMVAERNGKNIEGTHHHHHHSHAYAHARSVEHLNHNGIDRRKEDPHIEQIRKFGNDLRSVRSLDFDSDTNDKKRQVDYTSEPVGPRIRPTPPKKPLRLSLQRAQSLQTVELNQQNELDKKRSLKRAHHSEKSHETAFIENNMPLQTASLGRHTHV